jgi:hypothetical protein
LAISCSICSVAASAAHSAPFRQPESADPESAAHDPAPAVAVCHRHPLYVRLPGDRPLLIGASRLPPRIFLPLNIVGALVWALLFTTIGYLGGEVVGPWLHHLDAHLKHWIWLILAVLVVVAAHWWLRRRESKKKD